MATSLPFNALTSAVSNCRGNCKCLANPLPEPIGIMPNGIVVSVNAEATSFIVPSPPIAIIFVAFCSIAFLANSLASNGLVVSQRTELGIACKLAIHCFFCASF